jgi:phage terminase large subunit-like protein
MKDPTTHVTRGTTYENLQNLAEAFRAKVIRRYEGTRLGRQELLAEVLTDVPGALWTLDQIDATRVRETPPLVYVVVAIDPMTRSRDRDGEEDDEQGGETGIIVAGLGQDGHGYVLNDATTHGPPADWAAAAINSYVEHQADVIVGEVNNGGDMVGYVIGSVDPRVPFSEVWASRGKFTRAEPISALYARRYCHHVGIFPELEEQMTTWVPGEKSPDRMDALVWATSRLFYPQKDDPAQIVSYDGMISISPVWR